MSEIYLWVFGSLALGWLIGYFIASIISDRAYGTMLELEQNAYELEIALMQMKASSAVSDAFNRGYFAATREKKEDE